MAGLRVCRLEIHPSLQKESNMQFSLKDIQDLIDVLNVDIAKYAPTYIPFYRVARGAENTVFVYYNKGNQAHELICLHSSTAQQAEEEKAEGYMKK